MCSVLKHHPDRRFYFYILTDKPTRDEFGSMMRWVENCHFAFEHYIISVDSFEPVHNHKIPAHISWGVVNKLRLDEVLPNYVIKVVYHYSHTLFLDAADKLLRYELDESAVVRMPDNSVPIQLEVDNFARFLDAGVLKFDLKE